MAQTFAQILLHIIFSTKERRASLNEPWRNELFAYMGGIVRSLGGLTGTVTRRTQHPIDHGSRG